MSHSKKIFLLFFAFAVAASGLAVFTVDRSGATLGLAQGVDTLPQGFEILPARCRDPKQVAANCRLSEFLQLIANIIRFLVNLTLIIAPILIVVGGLFIMTAGGSAERMSKGKSIIMAAVVGIVIALTSYLIIKLLFLALGANVPNQGSFLP